MNNNRRQTHRATRNRPASARSRTTARHTRGGQHTSGVKGASITNVSPTMRASGAAKTPSTPNTLGTPGASKASRAASTATAAPEVRVPSNSETLVSRRNFLYGAIGVGAAAIAIGAGAAAYSSYKDAQESSQITYLEVPEDAVIALTDLEALDSADDRLTMTATVDMRLGTLVWCNSDDVAACLVPTDSGSPLTTVSLVPLGSAADTTVLEAAVGAAEGFEIYDVRATAHGMIWTEANILDGQWRIYTAPLSDLVMGTPVMVDSADETFETPTIAAVENYAFWQVMPSMNTYENADVIPETQLKRTTFGSSSVDVVYTSARRFGTPLYACEDGVVITPRADSKSVYYQLTKIDAKSAQTVDQLTLPQGMAPLEAGYGKNGFMWSFEKIYSYGDGIANMGTYTPMTAPSAYNYDGKQWFCFGRTPTAAPAWCGDLLVVKSSYSVCGVDLADKQYFALDVDNGADDYGEYLASTGTHERIVTFTSIDYQPVNEAAVQTCRIKIWA